MTTWKRARRRWRCGSHHRSSTGHGPAQPVIATGGDRRWPSVAGGALTSPRPPTRTGPPWASASSAGWASGGTTAGDGAGSDPGHGPGRWRAQPLGGVVGVGEVGGRRRHPPVAVAGQATTAPRRHQHALVAHHPGQPADRPRRPLVGRRRPAPQAPLLASSPRTSAGRQAQQHHPGRDVVTLHPRLQLPPHPLDHRQAPTSPPPGTTTRSLRSPCSVSAVTTSRVHTRPSAASPATSSSARCLPANTSGSSMHDRVVERLLDATVGRRFDGVGRTVVERAGQVVGVAAGRPEAGQDVAGRQGGQLAQPGQPHAGEQPHQLDVDLARLVQPGHRQRREERRRGPRWRRRGTGRRPAGGDGRGEATVGHTDPDAGRRSRDLGTKRRGARRSARRRRSTATGRGRRGTSHPGSTTSTSGREAGDRPHDGLEGAGVAVRVVVEQHEVGTALLGAATALPDRPRPRRPPPACGRRPGWRAARRPARRGRPRPPPPASRGTRR